MTPLFAVAVYIAVAFGIAWGIGHAGLSYPIRRRLTMNGFEWTVMLLECVGCSGFHIGWIAYAAGAAPPTLTSWWTAAFFTATTNLLVFHATGLDREL